MPYASQRQKAAHEARLFTEHMAKLRKSATLLPRVNPLTGKPLEIEMAKQAKAKQDDLDSMLREGERA